MAKLVIKTEGMPAEVIELKRGVNRLGRSARNDFQIDHHSISRFHAEIELHEDGMIVRDMDSSNGVFVNGEQVNECLLETGQTLRLGDVIQEINRKKIESVKDFDKAIKDSSLEKGILFHIYRRGNSFYLTYKK